MTDKNLMVFNSWVFLAKKTHQCIAFGIKRRNHLLCPYMFHIGWAHEREVVLEHSIAPHKLVLN